MNTQTSSGLNETSFLNEALALASKGFAVFPLPPRAEFRTPDTPEPQEATTDTSQIVEWWTETPDANIGIATGAQADLLVISVFDGGGKQLQGEKLLSDLEARHSPLPETLQASLRDKYRFLYFRYPAEVESIKGSFGANISVTPHHPNEVGYIVAPPSSLKFNSRCEWVNNRPRADLPKWAMWELAIPPDVPRYNPDILPRRPLDPEARSEILGYFHDDKMRAFRAMAPNQPWSYRKDRVDVKCCQNEFYRAMRGEELNSDVAEYIEHLWPLVDTGDWRSDSMREVPDDPEERKKWIELHIGSITLLHEKLFSDWSYSTLRNVVIGRGTKQNEQELHARLDRFRQRKRHELRAHAARDKKAAPESYRRGGLAERQRNATKWRERRERKQEKNNGAGIEDAG